MTTTEPTEAVVVREAPAALPLVTGTGAPEVHATTPAQAKVEAIANLTFKAYERASTLTITPDEAAALAADFPDEAFKQGAGGNPELIYIEHAYLRDRLSKVFGPGQWAIIPRNRWAEDFRTKNGDEASRVYVEAMLVIRGCFVSEAVGDMVYYKNNATQNYGDAVEGAKTACLRRCAKELGIGLQAWKKDFCEGWKQRRRQPAQAKPAPAPAPAKPPTVDPAKLRERMIAVLTEHKLEDAARAFAEQSGWIMPNETLADIPDNHVPRTKAAMDDLRAAIGRFVDSGEVPSAPDPADQVPGAEVEAEREPWMDFPMPFGKHAGVKLHDLEKPYLFGLWANYTVETEYNGKPKRAETVAKDKTFRTMLDAAGVHYQFTKKEDKA